MAEPALESPFGRNSAYGLKFIQLDISTSTITLFLDQYYFSVVVINNLIVVIAFPLLQLKLGFIAQSCLSPGFSTLLANIFSMRSNDTVSFVLFFFLMWGYQGQSI